MSQVVLTFQFQDSHDSHNLFKIYMNKEDVNLNNSHRTVMTKLDILSTGTEGRH